MKKGFSIIVCCYNSSEVLQETIVNLFQLEIPQEISAEIILIDNDSSDNTFSLAEKILNESYDNSDSKLDYKILVQKTKGLSSARSMGIENAEYEYLIFCDDDNRLHKDYIKNSLTIMNSNPDTAVLGGESFAKSDMNLPDWFDNFSNNYAAGKQNNVNGEVIRGEIWGAGMVLRKSAVDELYSKGFISLLSDRTGNNLSSGGDIELCYALRLAGWEIRYNDSLKLDHFINSKKLTWKYLRKLNRGFGVQKVYLDAYIKNNEPVVNLTWKKEALKIIQKIKRTGILKTAGSNYLKEGNPDSLKIEKLLGKLFEIYKIREKYTENIEKISSAEWNKRSKINSNKNNL